MKLCTWIVQLKLLLLFFSLCKWKSLDFKIYINNICFGVNPIVFQWSSTSSPPNFRKTAWKILNSCQSEYLFNLPFLKARENQGFNFLSKITHLLSKTFPISRVCSSNAFLPQWIRQFGSTQSEPLRFRKNGRHNLWDPEENEKWRVLVQKLLRILRWQH